MAGTMVRVTQNPQAVVPDAQGDEALLLFRAEGQWIASEPYAMIDSMLNYFELH